MEYDPVKDKLQRIIGSSVLARRFFFAVMDRLFLRSRYVAREISRRRREGFAPAEMLDAGSGFGQYSFRLARQFPSATVTGVDLKPDLIASGNRFAQGAGQRNLTFRLGDLLQLEETTRFDLILSVDVLEHIEDDRGVLRNLGRALKPGGIFIMTTPYWAGANGGQAPPEVFIAEHVRPGYSREGLREKLEQGSMDLEQFTITYGPKGRIAWLLLQRGPMSWLSGRIWLLPLLALYFLFAYPVAWVFMQWDLRSENRNGGGILAVARKR